MREFRQQRVEMVHVGVSRVIAAAMFAASAVLAVANTLLMLWLA